MSSLQRLRRRNVARIVLAMAGILLVPLVAMRFTDEVVWTAGDFAAAGALLAGTGLLYELASSRARTIAQRVAAGVALAAALLVVWVELAVGIWD